MTETDIVIAALKAKETEALDAAKGFDQKASDATNTAKRHERDATSARSRAVQFRTAITKLGA